MTTPGYPDWTAPVASVEHDVLLGSGVAQVGNLFLGPFDCSGLNSVLITTFAQNIPAATEYMSVSLQWSVAGQPLIEDTYTVGVAVGAQSNPAASFSAQIPVRGAQLLVSVAPSAGSLQLLTQVIGSTRQIPQKFYSSRLITDQRMLMNDYSNHPIGAGASQNWVLGPVPESYTMYAFTGGTGLTYTLNRVDGDDLSPHTIFSVTLGAAAQLIGPIPSADATHVLTVANPTGGALSYAMRVWDSS